jgi:hypothetical protein
VGALPFAATTGEGVHVVITMTWLFYWFSLAIVGIGVGFFTYWTGRDSGEKAVFAKRQGEFDSMTTRIRELSLENMRLKRDMDRYATDAYFANGVWNNERVVSDQSET